MANLKFFVETQDEIYLRKAEEAGDFLLSTVEKDDMGFYWKSDGEIPLGYGHGASGISTFLLYLYLAGGGEKFLETGIRALDFDLNNATPNLEDGLSWKRIADQETSCTPTGGTEARGSAWPRSGTTGCWARRGTKKYWKRFTSTPTGSTPSTPDFS
jgi:hypothetical protein